MSAGEERLLEREKDAVARMKKSIEGGMIGALEVALEDERLKYLRVGGMAVMLSKHLGLALSTLKVERDAHPEIRETIDWIVDNVKATLQDGLDGKI